MCPNCRTRHDEWEEDHNAYYVDSWRCLGCEKLEWEKQSWADDASSAKGIYFRLVKAGERQPITMRPQGI